MQRLAVDSQRTELDTQRRSNFFFNSPGSWMCYESVKVDCFQRPMAFPCPTNLEIWRGTLLLM